MIRWNTIPRKWRLIAALIIAVVAAVLLLSHLTRYRPAEEEFAAFLATDWEQVEAGAVLLSGSWGPRCSLYETPQDLERLRAVVEAGTKAGTFDWEGPADGSSAYTVTLLLRDGTVKQAKLGWGNAYDREAGKAYFCLLRGEVNGHLHYPTILVEMPGLQELAEDPVYEISQEEYEALSWVKPHG